MKKFRYSYQSIIRFSMMATRHNFKLRCLAGEYPFQKLTNESLQMYPQAKLEYGTDAFGNRIQYGHTLDEHDAFTYTSSGVVEQTLYRIPDPQPHPMYLAQSPLTAATDELKAFAEAQRFHAASSTLDRIILLMHAVYGHMTYCQGVTINDTTAGAAFSMASGVCQDYAHILIALCRLHNIPARYANGLIPGIGFTHAWVEAYDGSQWVAADPTNDKLAEYGYIKIAHGRDASDCPVNRGVIMGSGWQTSEIRVIAEEID